MIRQRRRRAQWSADEAAHELHARRAELVAQARRRAETRGVPVDAVDEIVSDAITAVVMSPRSIANENHLIGAFWLAVDHRCRRYREGRSFARLGSRQRVDFDLALTHAPATDNPFDRLDVADRFARAADLMADLDDRERQVVATMATRGVGPVSAAHLLGLPRSEVRSAARSATLKLDRIAVIAAAGRMCEFRATAVAAHAEGVATGDDLRRARTHLQACVPCSKLYREIRREMRSREFQRAAAAAFLPLPPALSAHGGFTRFAVWVEERLGSLPHGSGERAVEVVGGVGAAKVATAGGIIVLAGGVVAQPIVRAVESVARPAHHARHRATRESTAVSTRLELSGTAVLARAHVRVTSTSPERTHRTRTAGAPAPPSRSLGYLALGGPSATAAHSAYGATAARAASVSAAPAPEQTAAPSQSGGGSGLQYLGR